MTKKKRAETSSATGQVVNKSAAIRDVLTKDPTGKPQAVAQALADQGVQVSAAFVSQVKLKMKQRGESEPKRENGAGISQFESAELMEAKRLVDKLGVEKARAAVELLARLS